MEKQLATRFRKGDYITYVSGNTGKTIPARVVATAGDFAEVETPNGIAEITKSQCFKSSAKEYNELIQAGPLETMKDEVEEDISEEDTSEEDTSEEEEGSNGCVRRRYAKMYYERSGGNRDCADALAVKLRGMSIEEFLEFAAETLGDDVVAKYQHLNNGLKRMTLGNLIRKASK